MSKVAIVVQRCHSSVVGGSESLAWQYATLLRDSYEVEILTTTALQVETWENVLPPGSENIDGIDITRFLVTGGRAPNWGSLLGRLYRDYELMKAKEADGREGQTHLPWAVPLQEEFIRKQGPYSEPLFNFLRQHWSDYKAILFVTYLYPTTYFGIFQVPPKVCLLAPTLHDEPTAYLSAFKHAAHRARCLVWLTDGESRVGTKLWGHVPGHVVSMTVAARQHEPARLGFPYIIYSGRIDPNKGTTELFDFFIKYKESFPSDLKLVITGAEDARVRSHPDIEFRGFVSEEEKLSLMAGAELFVMPSSNESFSIVTLEAMTQGTALLANRNSDVVTDHVERSRGGLLYHGYESFSSSLMQLLTSEATRRELGNCGQNYARTRFGREQVRRGLLSLVESCTEVLTV